MRLPPLLWGKQTGKPVSSQSPHQAVSPKRPYHTAVCLLLSLIPLLVNFLHTTLHLSVPLGTASKTLHQHAEPSLCVCKHSMLMKSTGGSAAESMHATWHLRNSSVRGRESWNQFPQESTIRSVIATECICYPNSTPNSKNIKKSVGLVRGSEGKGILLPGLTTGFQFREPTQ